MIKRLKKKAFTLVELLVVIAILAILATAGIVGYTSFTKKAEISNDNSLVAELNNYVVAAKVSKDFNTVSEVRDELIPSGIDLAKLTPSAKNHGYSYGFDIKDDKFVLLEGTSLAEGYSVDKTIDVFVLVKNEAKATEYMNAGYSVYLQAGYDKTTVNASKGVDVGENTSITTVNYANTAEQTVVIRTNSYATDVNVETNGSVKHYGNVGKLNIEKVAMSSFHEFGKVRTVEIKEGNFVVEPKAVVTLISVVAETTGQVKIGVQSQGTVEVVAGDSDKYEATTPLPASTETINAPIEDNTLAIVNGVAKTQLEATDFGDGKKVVLLKDYETAVTLGSCEVVGNLVRFRANITGNKNITLKNVHSTGLFATEFTGSLVLDGGLLEYDSSLLANDENAAFYVNTGYGAYTFRNMTIAANTNKGIKISKAASVSVENCVFDASNLVGVAANDTSGTHARSLSAIDIQEQNLSSTMSIQIKDCSFDYIPQGELKYGADTDTSAAIKIKSEGQGFSSVVITGNSFVNCYRDVAIGVCVRKTGLTTFLAGKTPADMRANAIDSKFNISNNTTTQTAEKVANIGYLTFEDYSVNPRTGEAERVGRILGGCAVFETARSSHANDDQ